MAVKPTWDAHTAFIKQPALVFSVVIVLNGL